MPRPTDDGRPCGRVLEHRDRPRPHPAKYHAGPDVPGPAAPQPFEAHPRQVAADAWQDTRVRASACFTHQEGADSSR
jgi:hypothetical protein